MPSSLSSIKWPLLGTWKAEGHPEAYPGILSIENDNAYLTIFVEITHTNQQPIDNTWQTHPKLAPFRAPNQPTILGETKAVGKVTLFNCVESHYEATHHFDPPISRVELTLLVSQGWAGAEFVERPALYKNMKFTASGLHSILSACRVEEKWLVESTPERTSDTHELKLLTKANHAFLVFLGDEPSAEIKNYGKDYKITFSTSIGKSSSNTEGVTFGTTDFVQIETPDATLSQLQNVANQVEQFLSLLCIGPFRGGHVKVALDPIHEVELIWHLGRRLRSKAFTRLPHQILASLGRRPGLAAPALSSWFKAPESRRLARWLIFDSLFKDTSSTAKFLAVAQAWEILGRDKVNTAPYDKRKYQNACKAARVALEAHLDANAVERLYKLASSSNRKSFGDMVQEIISEVPQAAVRVVCPDIDQFVTKLVDVRNVLTHMEGKKKLSIESASYLSLFLTYKLILLFCIYDCSTLGLPLDNLPGMLANNDLAMSASRPLPKV